MELEFKAIIFKCDEATTYGAHLLSVKKQLTELGGSKKYCWRSMQVDNSIAIVIQGEMKQISIVQGWNEAFLKLVLS